MHILITNDDGPPSAESSPYVLPFVRVLQRAGHTVSVIVPDAQRSWIGKAHIIGQDVQATYYWPPPENPPTHHSAASANDDGSHPWILVNSTPAGCAQLGLSQFFFQDRGKIDLVVSGPNYGRNTTAVFALSSGTMGAALEAAVCGYRAIACPSPSSTGLISRMLWMRRVNTVSESASGLPRTAIGMMGSFLVSMSLYKKVCLIKRSFGPEYCKTPGRKARASKNCLKRPA